MHTRGPPCVAPGGAGGSGAPTATDGDTTARRGPASVRCPWLTTGPQGPACAHACRKALAAVISSHTVGCVSSAALGLSGPSVIKYVICVRRGFPNRSRRYAFEQYALPLPVTIHARRPVKLAYAWGAGYRYRQGPYSVAPLKCCAWRFVLSKRSDGERIALFSQNRVSRWCRCTADGVTTKGKGPTVLSTGFVLRNPAGRRSKAARIAPESRRAGWGKSESRETWHARSNPESSERGLQ